MSNDLISRSALMKKLEDEIFMNPTTRAYFKQLLISQPTVYDVDKVVEKLRAIYKDGILFEEVIEIVRSECGQAIDWSEKLK